MVLTTGFTVEMLVLATLSCEAVMIARTTIKDALSASGIPLVLQGGLVWSSSFSARRCHGRREQGGKSRLGPASLSQHSHPPSRTHVQTSRLQRTADRIVNDNIVSPINGLHPQLFLDSLPLQLADFSCLSYYFCMGSLKLLSARGVLYRRL
jgi:hypothetical protein